MTPQPCQQCKTKPTAIGLICMDCHNDNMEAGPEKKPKRGRNGKLKRFEVYSEHPDAPSDKLWQLEAVDYETALTIARNVLPISVAFFRVLEVK